MINTDNFRKQHRELLQIVDSLSGLLDEDRLKKEAVAARSMLSRLAGKLTVHLAMEDRHLYPWLFKHGDPALKSMAHRYFNELGWISDAFKNYKAEWPTFAEIQKRPANFISATRDILGVLSKRIDMENNELFPAVDEKSD